MEKQDPTYKLTPREEACLKVCKEIVVKYVELGRLGVANFSENFSAIYQAVRQAVDNYQPPAKQD